MTDRDLILAGTCPLCGRGTFKMPLFHVARVHGIGRRDARRMFGCSLTETLTCPDTHERMRQRRLGIQPPPRQRAHYTCAGCGATFEAYRYRDDDNIPRYCTRDCRHRAA